MAQILPFRALHYNPAKITDLGKVITQPYDKITPEMQARCYDLHSHNLVRIIRGRENPGDRPQDNVYTRAARDFREWRASQVLVSAIEPGLYPYYQEYAVPAEPGRTRRRRGFIALGRLENYSSRIVHRHEETLSGPKADRLELLRATRAHFGQIFMLYSDGEGKLESALEEHTQGPPWEQLHDEYGTLHSAWRITEPSTVDRVVSLMRDKKLVIADGHHRYETALAYRDYCRAQAGYNGRADYVMMTFVRMEADGLTILPTHRVVHALEGFDWQKLVADAQRIFDWEEIRVNSRNTSWPADFLQRLRESGRAGTTLGAYAGPDRLALLHLRKTADPAALLPDVFQGLRRSDVLILHRLLLEGVLGISRQAVREEKNLRYVREFDDARLLVETGQAQVCFLLNPTPVTLVWENALAGNVLPQKSTDFYPKLLSGLAIYWLDNPAGI